MVDKLNLSLGNIAGKVSPSGKSSVSSSDIGSIGTNTQKDFKDILLNSLEKVNKLQLEAEEATERLLSGQTDNIAEVFSAVRKADIAFSLMMQIRNQLMNAYSEIKNMRL